MPAPYKTDKDNNGRVCTFCWIYKPWSEFSRSKDNKTGYTPNCKQCRNEQKHQWRIKTNREVDRNYRNNKRHLKIGEQIYFNNDVREVLSYKFKKGYTVKSILNGTLKVISTADNHYIKNNSCVRFKKMLEPIVIKATNDLDY